ncbi:MAG: hypothetical protein Q4G68_11340 [Planctomycetia bacterium]|nr:hypothetical protein [Planctomycetia bacterium]
MTTKETRRKFLKKCVFTACSGFLLSRGYHVAEASEIGQTWSGWREGEMEIHSIYTGCGESIFHILPDGTTMLIDAGEWRANEDIKVDILPNETRHPGEWIARYIQRVNPRGVNVDYMMLSHFHEDHSGGCEYSAGRTQGRGDDYCISGLSEVGEYLHFDKAFDRGYPDYSFHAPGCEATESNFCKFVRWTMKEKGLKMEKFETGKCDQIKLCRTGTDEYDFHIRNLCANGVVWTGKDMETRNLFEGWSGNINENALSIGILFCYGPFRYFSAGDIDQSCFDANMRALPVEAIVGQATGPVDVCKANHHGCNNAMPPEFVQAVRPRVYTVNVYDQTHTGEDTLRTMMSEELYSGPRLVCPTIFPSSRKAACETMPFFNSIATEGGHVVIKVYDQGRKYKVYYLTADDESMKIKAVYGPFEASNKDA